MEGAHGMACFLRRRRGQEMNLQAGVRTTTILFAFIVIGHNTQGVRENLRAPLKHIAFNGPQFDFRVARALVVSALVQSGLASCEAGGEGPNLMCPPR